MLCSSLRQPLQLHIRADNTRPDEPGLQAECVRATQLSLHLTSAWPAHLRSMGGHSICTCTGAFLQDASGSSNREYGVSW